MNAIRPIAWGMCLVVLAFAMLTMAPRANPSMAGKLGDREFSSGRDKDPVSPEEWRKVEAWMQVNCPNRLGVFQRMNVSDAQKEHAKQLIVERYRQIEHTSYKPLADAMVREAQAQDQMFGAQIKLRAARRAGEKNQREAAHAELKAAVGKLVDADIEEKTARIGRLQGYIKDLKEKRPDYVERWTSRAENLGLGEGIRSPGSEPGSPGSSGTDAIPEPNP